jgi:predicted DNA-binding protein
MDPVWMCATMSHMNDNSRLTSVVFRLNRERLESLKELSRCTRIRQSEYLREAISDLLEKYDDNLEDA